MGFAFGNSITIKYVESVEESSFKTFTEDSIEKLLEFSKKENLGIKKYDSFVTEIVVYGTKPAFDKMISSSADWPKGSPVPKNYVGVGIKKAFHVVSWPVYQNIHPNENIEDYKKLLVHEMAHLLHIAFLKGKENKMGPLWFFEGFACLVANQYLESTLPQKDKMKEIISSSERGSYKDYAAMLRLLSKKRSVLELLRAAHKPDFGARSEKLLLEPGTSSDGK